MTDKNIQEAEVGSGTKIADTKKSEKRAQISLKLVQLRMKQEKERQALAAQKKSLQKEETMTESFSASQIAALKAEYSKINGIDPASDTYKKLIAMLDRLDLKSLKSLAGAEIKFVSKLAQNRVARKSMKEEVQLDELSTNKLADYKKKAGADATAADKAGDTKKGNKRFSGIMKATRKQFDNDAKKTNEGVAEEGYGTHPSQRVDPRTGKKYVPPKSPLGKGVAEGAPELLKKEMPTHRHAEKLLAQNGVSKDDPDYYHHLGNTIKHLRQFGNIDLINKSDKQGVAKKKTNEELDIELDEVLSKDATAGDFIHDFVNSDNPKFAGKTKEKRKQMALAAYYAKQKNEELSPKQKALDKNKNGKIDGSDLAKLRGEELSAKQKVLDKNNNGKIDGSDLAHLRSKKKQPQGADFAAQRRKERLASNGRMDEAKSDYEVYHKDYSTAVQTAIKQAEKRGYEIDMDDWHDKVATGPKKPSSGKTNSFSVKLKKDGKESKKALHLQVYNMDNHKYELNMYIEEIQLDELNKDTLHSYAKKSEKDQDDQYNKIGKGIRDKDPKSANKAGHKFSMRSIGQNRAEKRLAKEGVVDEAGPGLWANIQAKRERIKNGSNERMRKPGEKGAPEAGALDRAKGKNEAASPAQQAAIAIAMKKDGKKPKDMEEMTGDDKSSIALQAMVARKKLQQTDGKNKSQSFVDKMTSKANAGDRLPKKPADEYDRKVVKYLKKKHGMTESIVDKIKAIKRGMQAKAKADDHFDKAGDPKNANASKDLKKAVRYSNLLNKEEVVLEAKKPKSFKDVKKKMKEEETPNKSTVKKGDMLTGKKEPIEINPQLKS